MINLIILLPGRRLRLRREDPEIAKLRLAQLREKYGQHRVFVSYDTPKEPPKGFKRKGNLLWCSFCHKTRYFSTNHKVNLVGCPVCGITENNFYIKRHNRLEYTVRLVDGWHVQEVKLKKDRRRKRR